MAQLGKPVAMHDVENAEAFVRATLHRAPMRLDPDEFEELVAEGLLILADLAGRYEPHRAGYEQAGSFAGYAAKYLPRRLTDAWHRLNPSHRFVTDPGTGRREWVYDDRPVSLDALTEDRGDGNVQGSLRATDSPDEFDEQQLRTILEDRMRRELDLTVQVGKMLGEERPPSEVIAELGIRQVEFVQCVDRIAAVAHLILPVAA